MTLLLKYIEKIKINWIATLLTLVVQLNDLICLLGFFIVPFIKFPEVIRIPLLCAWIYTAVIFFIFGIAAYNDGLKNNDKEIEEYKKDKVVYTVGRIGILVYFVAILGLIFLTRNSYLKLSLLAIIGIAVLGLLLFAIIIALLTQYKNNYFKMAKDTVRFLFVFFAVIFFSIIMFIGVLVHGNEIFPKYFSEFLVGISAIPLLLGGIYLVCKMFLSSKMLNEKSDALPISIVLFIAIGIVTCILLRYAITDDKMQEIMTTIFAAILGGAITLAGVAWTIKDANVKRQEDLKRIEAERKEEERSKNIPYIKNFSALHYDEQLKIRLKDHYDYNNPSDRQYFENNQSYSIQISSFGIKNISNTHLIFDSVHINGNCYPFSGILIEKDQTCLINICDNSWITLTQPLQSINLILHDMIGNNYSVECKFITNPNIKPETGEETTDDGEKYRILARSYIVQKVFLPKHLVQGEEQ